MSKSKDRHKMQIYIIHETITTRYTHHVEATSEEEAITIVEEGEEDTIVDDCYVDNDDSIKVVGTL